MRVFRSFRAPVGAVALFVVLLAVSPASAGKHTVKYKDERSTGNFYDGKLYAKCDIRKMTATSKRGKLIVQLTFRGKVPEGYAPPIASMYVNTKGGKESKPEFVFGGRDKAPIYKITGFKGGSPHYNGDRDRGQARVKENKNGKGQQAKVAIKHFGKRLDKIGIQAQTCGEGAVDIAPGKDYFGKDYGDHIKFQSLELKL